MMFRGKGFKTQFNGSTSVMSTIAQVELLLSTACHVLTLFQFRELQAFTREALTIDHSIMRVKTGTRMTDVLVMNHVLTASRLQDVPR
jgi:hypothetical protein